MDKSEETGQFGMCWAWAGNQLDGTDYKFREEQELRLGR